MGWWEKYDGPFAPEAIFCKDAGAELALEGFDRDASARRLGAGAFVAFGVIGLMCGGWGLDVNIGTISGCDFRIRQELGRVGLVSGMVLLAFPLTVQSESPCLFKNRPRSSGFRLCRSLDTLSVASFNRS